MSEEKTTKNVFESCDALQIYPNTSGDVVLRQIRYMEDDVFIIIPWLYGKGCLCNAHCKKDAIDLQDA